MAAYHIGTVPAYVTAYTVIGKSQPAGDCLQAFRLSAVVSYRRTASQYFFASD